MKIIETERLLLKPTSTDDAAFIFDLMNSPLWIEHIGNRNITSIEEAENYISSKMLPQLKRLGYSNNTVYRKSDNAKIGSCGLYDRESVDGVDIGFAFLPDYFGNGYALEAAIKVKELAFSEYGLNKISAICTRANIASQKLIEKLGLKFIKNITIESDNEELLLYELNK